MALTSLILSMGLNYCKRLKPVRNPVASWVNPMAHLGSLLNISMASTEGRDGRMESHPYLEMQVAPNLILFAYIHIYIYTHYVYTYVNINIYIYSMYIYIYRVCIIYNVCETILLTSSEAFSQEIRNSSPCCRHSVAPVAAAWPLNRLVSLPVARCGSGGRCLDVHPANRIRGL